MDNLEFRTPLPSGTVLTCGNGDRYMIDKTISFGGSSVFYSAKKEGSALPFGIKECFPSELADTICREGGLPTGVDARTTYLLDQARARLLNETGISQQVAAVSGRTIPVWEAPDRIRIQTGVQTMSAPAGSFLILRQISGTGMFLRALLAECTLPKEDGRPLRAGGQPHIRTIARLLEQTLRAVELVHKAGYLYGDIQPDNLFLADARPERGDVGFGCLLDFGCARPFSDGHQTAPITDRMVFSTPGFTAPEIVWDNDGTLRLTPAADLYSIGRLLLYLLRGRTYFENGRDRMLTEGASLARLLPTERERLGCSGEALRLLQHILNHSLCLAPEERYQTAAEMLADVEELLRLTRPPRNQLALSVSALAEGEFLGREDLLLQLDRAVRQRRGPVILWGFAGMGKTELAIEFARRYDRGQAYFVRFGNSVRETVTGPIADAFSGYDRRDAQGREKPEEQIYREVMKQLGEQSETDLLILDNMDGDEGGFEALRGEPAFRELCALPMSLLVTTRSLVETGIEVDTLPLSRLRQLMRRFVPKLSDEMADNLIHAVEGHTLTVELMARTLKYSIPHISPEDLLDKMTAGDLDSKSFARVSSSKNRESKMARIQGHLTRLFHLADLPEEQRRLLSYALPISGAGLSSEDFARVPDFDQDTLLQLIDQGWIRRNEDDILTIHPLVQEIGWVELEPDTSRLCRFGMGLGARVSMDLTYTNDVIERFYGYLYGVYHHTCVSAIKTGAGILICDLLQISGQLQRAAEQAYELLQWLNTRPDDDVDSQYVREALDSYADCLDKLNHTEQAAEIRKLAESMGASLPRKPNKTESYRMDGVTITEAEMMARIAALQELMNQRQYVEALQKYKENRAWFSANKLDPTHLDIYEYVIWIGLGDFQKAYLSLQKVCAEMAEQKRPTGIFISLLLRLIDFELQLGRYKTGKALMGYTLKAVHSLSPDQQVKVLTSYAPGAIQTSLEQGWIEEAAAWRAALAELDREEP